MRIEDQVCSLELARKLKELGVRQQSYFCWYLETDGEMYLDRNMPGKRRITADNCAAFTVAELGEMLPTGALIPTNVDKVGKWWRQTKLFAVKHENNPHWHIYYKKFDTGEKSVGFTADTEADARAKMLVYLLENGVIK